MLEITWQNIESVIKRLTELGLFKWIHYVKLENSLVHDVSQESNNKLHKQVVQIPVSSTTALALSHSFTYSLIVYPHDMLML